MTISSTLIAIKAFLVSQIQNGEKPEKNDVSSTSHTCGNEHVQFVSIVTHSYPNVSSFKLILLLILHAK